MSEIDLNLNDRLRDHAFAVEYVSGLEEAHHDKDKRYEARLAHINELEAKLARINQLAVSLRDGIGTGPHVSGLRTLVQNIVEASR
ncbi:MAG: hypothetical protein JNL45_17835 [Hyphomicrobium sp.]|jgi:hypothetical protein|nr:hypothetical protein [Hyphomicrobium sp.]